MDLNRRKKIYWLAFILLLFIVYLFFKEDVGNRIRGYSYNYNGYNSQTNQPQQYNDVHSADSNNDDAKGLLDKLLEDEEREHQNNSSYGQNQSSSSSSSGSKSESSSSSSTKVNEQQDNNDKDIFD